MDIRSTLLFFALFCTYIGDIKAQEPSWVFNTHAAIYGGVTVEGGNLYFGNEGGELYALNSSGKKKWMVLLEGAIKSKPGINGNALYINTDLGYLYAINKKSGKTIWKKKVGHERRYDLWDYYLSSPIFYQNKLFMGLGDGSVLCLDAKSADVIWEFQTGEPVHATPVIHKDLVLIGGFDGVMYALAHENGELKWSFDTEGTSNYPKGEIQKEVSIAGDIGYFSCRGNYLYAVNLESGAETGSYFEPGSWIIASPLISNEMIYFGTSDSQVFRALGIRTLEPVWSVPSTMRIYGKALLSNDHLYFGTFDGRIQSASLTGEVGEFQYQSPNSKSHYDLIYNEQKTFRNDILQLYGTNMPAAEALLNKLGAFAGDLEILNDILIASDIHGTIYAFDVKKT